MSNAIHQKELLLRYLDGNVSDVEREQAESALLSDPEARDFVRMVAEHAVCVADLERTDQWLPDETELIGSGSMTAHETRILKAVGTTDSSAVGNMNVRTAAWVGLAVAGLIGLILALVFDRDPDRAIAKISGLGGPLIWTGDGGQVTRDLSVGTQLTGGTIEAVAEDSWAEIKFNDGSTMALAGTSLVTFSDRGQKEIHLWEGNVTAKVTPQPADQPMLVHTRSAVLEVLGTQFSVKTDRATTSLNVNEGKVRIRRLSDGSSVEVPANHRVTAAADRVLSPVLVPHSVGHWESQLNLGPKRTRGNWVPKLNGDEAGLLAVPLTIKTRQGKTITLYNTSFQVSHGDESPVVVQEGSRLRVHGRVSTPQRIYIGLTVHKRNGDFAGNFQRVLPATKFTAGAGFELTLSLEDFSLDPSLAQIRDQLPAGPAGLVVQSFWCHSLDQPAGLGIFKVQLVSPSEKTLGL